MTRVLPALEARHPGLPGRSVNSSNGDANEDGDETSMGRLFSCG